MAARTTSRALWVLPGLALLVAGPLTSQTTSSTVVEGIVVDQATGLPVPNVQVRFDTGQRQTSNEDGLYHFEGIAPGVHRVALVTGRCNVTFAALELAEGEIRQVAFAIPSETDLPSVIQDQQKRKSEGIFLTTADLDEHNVRSLVDVLRREAPEMVGTATSGLPGGANQLTSRTRSARGVAAPVVILDGIQTGDGARLLRDLRPVDVATMEILRGASGGWAYGTGASGGVIRLTTRQGDRGAGLLHPDRCEVPDFEGGTAAG